MESITLVPMLPVSEEFISSLAMPLESVFHTAVKIEPAVKNVLHTAYDSSRAQYNSTILIKYLLRRYDRPETKVLGITSVDLFVPVLTYVFGEAQLSGSAGVMSVYRLDETLYGMESDPIVFFERTLKEAVHELGHTFGLLHCRNYNCSMHSSTTVEEVDLKGAGLCDDCMEQIGI